MGRPKGSTNKNVPPVLVGQTYGRLTVLETGHFGGRYPSARCLCSCGVEKIVRTTSLRTGQTTSCGCFAKECARQTIENAQAANLKHGHAYNQKKTKEYQTWCGVLSRCSGKTPSSLSRHYGRKGIQVCDRWKDSFENFLEDMGSAPSPKHTLDRIDGNKGYAPENCRWATWKEQAVNRCTTVWVEVNGVRMSLSDASTACGLNYGTVQHRVRKLGWPMDRALNTPARPMRRQK